MDHYIVIIGAMKAGTTTLFKILAQHPQIAPAKKKEPGFFAFDEVWEKGYSWYHSLFDYDPEQHRYRLEASTDYTKAPFVENVWERMSADPSKRFKLIYIVRDPIARIESHAAHTQISQKELGQNVSSRASQDFDNGISMIALTSSCYAHQISQFETPLASGDLHILSLEEFRQDPQGTQERLMAFLDLPKHEDMVELPRYNAGDQKKHVVPLWGTLSSIRPLMAIGRVLLPVQTREKIKQKFKKPTKNSGRFKLEADEIIFLKHYFKDDLYALQSKYGVDTSQFVNFK